MSELKQLPSVYGGAARKISASEVVINDDPAPVVKAQSSAYQYGVSGGKLVPRNTSANAQHLYSFGRNASDASPDVPGSNPKEQQRAYTLWSNLTEFASSASFHVPRRFHNLNDVEVQQRNICCMFKVSSIFVVNGIMSMLYWNVVLSTFDYFSEVYPGHNVYLFFPIPNFLSAMVGALLFNLISSRFSYKRILVTSILTINACMGLLLIISVVSHSNPPAGFYASIGICLVTGFFGIMIQLSYCGMINYFDERTVANFNIGVGASGLFMTLLRIAITAVYLKFNTTNQVTLTPVLVFFIIAVAFNFFGLALNLALFRKPIYKVRIVDSQRPLQQELNQSRVRVAAPSQPGEPEHTPHQLSQSQKNSYPKLLWGALMATKPFPVYIFINGLIMFMLFPNLTMAKTTGLPKTWSNLIFLLMFNGGNLAGKVIGGSRGLVNKWVTTYLVLGRMFFFYTIIFMLTKYASHDFLLSNNYFPYFNQLIFALSSGILLNSCFILTFECAPPRYKKYAGVLNGTLYQLGVMLGTFAAVPMQYAVKSAQ